MAVDASQIASRGESDSYACDFAAIRVHHLTGHYGQFIMLLVLELSSARFLKILYILIFYLAQAALEIAEQGHGYYYADSKATEQLLPGVYVLGEGIDYPPGEKGQDQGGDDGDQHGPHDGPHLIALEERGGEDKSDRRQDQGNGRRQARPVAEELDQPQS